MRTPLKSRGLILRAIALGLLAGLGAAVCAQQHAAPIERRPPPGQAYGGGAARSALVGPNQPRANGEHLAEWMNQHRGLTLQQQQQALQREPGFRELPPQTQQRMMERLAQLNAMSPMQRQRTLERTEVMERLTPLQRSEVRGAMQELGSLPPDQRRDVARSFRELRQLPPNQRMLMLNSGRYGWLNYEQRTTLTNLLQVEPMLPPE